MVSLLQARRCENPCIALPGEAHWAGSGVPTDEFMGILLVVGAADRFTDPRAQPPFSSLWL